MNIESTREGARQALCHHKSGHWNRWGPIFAERAWGSVREDNNADGDAYRPSISLEADDSRGEY